MEKPRDNHSLNEGQPRYILITPTLRVAGWKIDDRASVTDFGCKHTMIAFDHGYSS
ncbi:MAG: hypothetical protein K2Y31_07735 [Burkholderiales bacterium]|jgi:type I site-specific restriction endonuclease|nr:hypothetical protein [Burkholderiales bacterium]